MKDQDQAMEQHGWVREFPGAVTVCDPDGIILEMNKRSEKMFQEQGGAGLLGSNLLDCHPEPARAKLKELLETRQMNAYTIEKNGRKKLIYQAPWYNDGAYAGFVEIAVDLPDPMPHFIRKGS